MRYFFGVVRSFRMICIVRLGLTFLGGGQVKSIHELRQDMITSKATS
jgi:hypothetical protein